MLLAVAACSGSNESEGKKQPVPKSTLTGTLPRHMRNCPSGVTSAETTSSKTADGVEVTITSPDPSAQKEIVKLAAIQAARRGPIQAFPEHSGLHGGPGTMGRCPIIHLNTSVSYVELANGVRLHIAANDPSAVALLQRATEDRVRALQRPAS